MCCETLVATKFGLPQRRQRKWFMAIKDRSEFSKSAAEMLANARAALLAINVKPEKPVFTLNLRKTREQ
jgi:hypothetical protein